MACHQCEGIETVEAPLSERGILDAGKDAFKLQIEEVASLCRRLLSLLALQRVQARVAFGSEVPV
jgi:hypothetical protein